MLRSTLCAIVFVLSAPLLLADEVWLKNDSVIEGTILLERSDRVVIQTAGGKVTIPRDQISRVVKKKVQPPEPPPSTNGQDSTPPPPKEETKPPKEETKPPKEETKPPKEETKPPKEETKPPKEGDRPPQPPKVVVEAKSPSQKEFLDLLERRGSQDISDEERVHINERLGELASQDLEFTFRVFDAGPMNRSIQVLGIVASLKDPMALPLLEERLGSGNPSIRSAIVSALGVFEGDEHIDRLRERLVKEEPSVQAAILEQFERRAFVEATEEILPLIVSPVETVRNRSLAALKRFSSIHTMQGEAYDLGQHLATAYADEPQGALALPLLRLLTDIGGTTAVETLRSALSSELTEQRQESARGLGRLAARAATMDLLVLAEEDEDAKVRIAAIKALELIKDPAATERLIALLDTEDAEIITAVHRTLKVITNQTIGKSYDEWAAWWATQQ